MEIRSIKVMRRKEFPEIKSTQSMIKCHFVFEKTDYAIFVITPSRWSYYNKIRAAKKHFYNNIAKLNEIPFYLEVVEL